MEVGEYLKKTYGSSCVKKLSNGNYYVKTSDNTEIYVPKDFDPSTKVYAYIPGNGGAGKDARRLRQLMESGKAPNYVTVISPDSNDSTHILDVANKVVTDNNSSVDGVVIDGFSLGARQTMPSLSAYLKKHPELAKSSAIIMTDGWVKDYYKDSSYNILKENGVQIVYISGSGEHYENCKDPKVETIVGQLAGAGFNVIGVESVNAGHNGYNDDAIVNGFAEFLFGDSDTIYNKSVNSTDPNFAPNYKFYVYDAKTGEYKEIFDITKNKDFSTIAFIKISEGVYSYVNLEDLDVSALTKAKAFDVKEEPSSVVTTYKSLTELQPLSIKIPSSYTQTDGIVSDMNFIVSSMNQIRGDISSSEFLTGLKSLSCRSGAGIPGIIMSQISKYFGAVGDLLTMLSKETKSVTSIAQAWLEFDEAMAKAAEGIGTVGSIVPIEETPPAEDTPETPKDPSPKSPSPKGPSTPKDPSPKTPETPETPKTPVTPETPETPVTPETPETPSEPKHTVVVEDDKITQKMEDGSILEVDYKDGVITSISFKYVYESEAKAQEALEGLVKKYNLKEYISEIKVDGKAVEVKFDDKILEKIDVTKLKENITAGNDNAELKLIDLLETQIKGEK